MPSPSRPVLLTALIVDNALCMPCIAEHAGMTLEAVESALTVIERVLALHRKSAVCGRCGVHRVVCFLERPPQWGPR